MPVNGGVEADSSRMSLVFDVVVAGGGPAGLTAATAAADCGAEVCLIEPGLLGGHLNKLSSTGIDDVSGFELGLVLQQKASEKDVAVLGDSVVAGGWTSGSVVTEGGVRIQTRRFIVATGKGPGLMNDPWLASREGSGVTHCVECDASLARGGPIVAICRGVVGASEALAARSYTSDLTIVLEVGGPPLPEQVLEAADLVIVDDPVAGLSGERTVDSVVLRSGRRLPAVMVIAKDEGHPEPVVVSEGDEAVRLIGHAAGWSGPLSELLERATGIGRAVVQGL